ncbi:hypothetical protein BaRGS_00002368 [Batillaria attramentaria]|uniref:Uncharacterized protein n=1 Tax=Batillaria attramentaria TaxID=370345 RepID=A0ABD0M424_9CAEN
MIILHGFQQQSMLRIRHSTPTFQKSVTCAHLGSQLEMSCAFIYIDTKLIRELQIHAKRELYHMGAVLYGNGRFMSDENREFARTMHFLFPVKAGTSLKLFLMGFPLGFGASRRHHVSRQLAKKLERLFEEASFAVQARAVKDYFNLYDPQSLAFKEGDIITLKLHIPSLTYHVDRTVSLGSKIWHSYVTCRMAGAAAGSVCGRVVQTFCFIWRAAIDDLGAGGRGELCLISRRHSAPSASLIQNCSNIFHLSQHTASNLLRVKAFNPGNERWYKYRGVTGVHSEVTKDHVKGGRDGDRARERNGDCNKAYIYECFRSVEGGDPGQEVCKGAVYSTLHLTFTGHSMDTTVDRWISDLT